MKDILDKLEKLLDQEKECLLIGDYVSLETLSKNKVILSQVLETSSPVIPKDAALRLKEKSLRNKALLTSAQRGLQSAISHLTEAADGSFHAYSKEGKRAPLLK